MGQNPHTTDEKVEAQQGQLACWPILYHLSLSSVLCPLFHRVPVTSQVLLTTAMHQHLQMISIGVNKHKTRRRQWQPTPVLLPGKSHGRRSLIGYSPWGHKESNMTEQWHTFCSCHKAFLNCTRYVHHGCRRSCNSQKMKEILSVWSVKRLIRLWNEKQLDAKKLCQKFLLTNITC